MLFFCQADQIAIVIIRYKVVHTGAKTQSGGLKLAFVKDEYHGSLDVYVATPPIKDAKEVVIAKIIKDKKLTAISTAGKYMLSYFCTADQANATLSNSANNDLIIISCSGALT